MDGCGPRGSVFGKSQACASGTSSPSSDGPSSTPATISLTTWVWPKKRRPMKPQARQAARITASCRKSFTVRSCGLIRASPS